MTREEIKKQLDKKDRSVYEDQPGPYHNATANMAALLLSIHEAVDTTNNDERTPTLNAAIKNIKHILGR